MDTYPACWQVGRKKKYRHATGKLVYQPHGCAKKCGQDKKRLALKYWSRVHASLLIKLESERYLVDECPCWQLLRSPGPSIGGWAPFSPTPNAIPQPPMPPVLKPVLSNFPRTSVAVVLPSDVFGRIDKYYPRLLITVRFYFLFMPSLPISL